MIDGPTKRAVLVTDVGRGRSIQVPAFFGLCGNQAKSEVFISWLIQVL